ncbi:cytidine deaminase-like protein [Xylaria venustula]|nr:cytidine deaminase-like protein [Xylaria venustula]
MTSTFDAAAHSPAAIIKAILKVAHERIIPLTRKSFAKNGAPFGAAVLDRDSNLELVAVAVNDWQACPIYHGETNCIIKYSEVPQERRPAPEQCIFFATHEPCSLCLSSFAWTGFRIIYFLFSYEDIHRMLKERKDVEIIKEIFKVPESSSTEEGTKETGSSGLWYNKRNKFFSVYSLQELLEEVEDAEEQFRLQQQVAALRDAYEEFRHNSEDSGAT